MNTHYGLPTKATLGQALTRFLTEISPNRQGARWEILRLRSFAEREKLLCARQLSSLSEADFSAFRDRRLLDVSASTVRRELALLGAVLGIARREWKWLSHDPLKIKKPKEPPARRRGVSRDEVIGILSHANDQVSCAFLLALETGMRAGEILSLTWGNVDLEKRTATLPKTKNGDSRQVPLSSTGVHLLQLLPSYPYSRLKSEPRGVLQQVPANRVKSSDAGQPPLVFDISSKSLDVLFRRARDAAIPVCPSIATLRFHDSRSEAITRLSRKLEVLELARAVGHRDPRSLMFYYSTSAEDLAKKLG